MKYRNSKRLDEWSWITSVDDTALRAANAFMETSNYGDSIELTDCAELKIKWQSNVPFYIDEELYIDPTTTVTKRGTATVKTITNIGHSFIVIAFDGEKNREVQFLLKGSFAELI